jgi:NarL family two-component system response regulator LiaR
VGHSVLIVDDHAAFRQVVRALLVGAGFEVVGEAAGGAEAVAQSGRLRPGVVLLDVQLPGRLPLRPARSRFSAVSRHR